MPFFETMINNTIMAITKLNEFKQLIAELQIEYTPAEFHGFLSGLVAGGIKDESWQTLTYQFTNDGHCFSQIPLKKLTEFYQQLTESYSQADTQFQLCFDDNDDGFKMADKIADWTSHFMLGIGLAQPKFQTEKDEVGEALDDLNEISKLGYDEQDNPAELASAADEIIEYLRVVALFLHSHFALSVKESDKKQLH
ncbi:Uncharacterized protein conserved in bacteria [Phocoenobacter uteri]|uniref:Uncharacterized protein conserved in bacteria n=2 Tax=Phocoenobacter uteri TaxID=146806 RepID=A0A379C7I2_9PAST|nr:Uncharacterized protein conserved in bacteria [Phocoenobacter uteri]